MLAYVVRRLFFLIPTILVVGTLVFFGMHYAPGDPASIMLGLYANDETVKTVRHEMGLDRPILTQYASFLTGLARGDLGESFHEERPVVGLVLTAFYPTLLLVAVSMGFSLLMGSLLGLYTAIHENSFLDSFGRLLSVVGVSAPVFWVGILLMILFAVHLKWFPVAGYGTWRHLVLPSLALSGQSIAFIARLFRSNLIEQKRQDYVRTARAKGISEKRLWLCHISRNSLLSVVTMVGVRFATLLGGAVIVENVFAWPGLGTLIVRAVSSRDYPILLGAVMWIAIVISVVNLLVDILYSVLDPKIIYT